MIMTIIARACQRVTVTCAVPIALQHASIFAEKQARTRLVALLTVVAVVANALAVLARTVTVAAQRHTVHLLDTGTAFSARLSTVTVRALAHIGFRIGIGIWDTGTMT